MKEYCYRVHIDEMAEDIFELKLKGCRKSVLTPVLYWLDYLTSSPGHSHVFNVACPFFSVQH